MAIIKLLFLMPVGMFITAFILTLVFGECDMWMWWVFPVVTMVGGALAARAGAEQKRAQAAAVMKPVHDVRQANAARVAAEVANIKQDVDRTVLAYDPQYVQWLESQVKDLDNPPPSFS